ncbi:MAG: hypothetical protein A2293_10540 [Elusimicrobia bacterium RIFOXYB2_FULL_49_7]|nr:MAG: hypothetical protein A2293_10540 [Elusimicrobia bacterium RIFOXYB2_FULL_49_7]
MLIKTLVCLFALSGVSFFIGCSASYAPPSLLPRTFVYNIAGNQEALTAKVVGILKALDYDIAMDDPGTGLVRVMAREIKVLPDECDCGKLYGKSLVSDPATTIKILIEIYIQDGRIRFVTNYSFSHKNRNGRVDRVGECISPGVYERQLVDLMLKQPVYQSQP